MRERTVEQHLSARVRALGGVALKITPDTHAGAPDRLVLLPHLPPRLVELKSPTGRLSAVQQAWHERSTKQGHPVTVLSTTAEVDAWLTEVYSAVN